MNQENVNKLIDWIKNNQNYSVEQLRQSALQSGFSEDDFNAAANSVNTPVTTFEYKGVWIRFVALIIDMIIFGIIFWIFAKFFSDVYVNGCENGSYVGITKVNGTFYGLCGFPALVYFLLFLLIMFCLNGKSEVRLVNWHWECEL